MARTGRGSSPSGGEQQSDAGRERTYRSAERSARSGPPTTSRGQGGGDRGDRRRHDAPQNRGQPPFRSASSAQAGYAGDRHDDRRHRNFGFGERYHERDDIRYARSQHQQDQYQRGRGGRHRRSESRGDGRGRDNYRNLDDRDWRGHGGPHGSSWGRESEPRRGNYDHSHDDRRGDRQREDYHSRGDSRHGDYSHRGHRVNYNSEDNSEQSMKRQRYEREHERRPREDQSAPIRNEYQARASSRHGQQVPPAPPSAPAREELSENERLKQELERARLQTELARQRLETEKLNQMRMDLQARKSAPCSEASLKPAAAKASAARDPEGSASAQKSAPTQSAETTTQEASATSRKKKSNRRGSSGGRAKLFKETKQQLREAQKANDEQKKHELLQAYEEELAANAMHPFSEKDLMSQFQPQIIDHHLSGTEGKLRVKWVPGKGKSTQQNSVQCTSWVSHEDFLFPALARKHLLDKAKSAPPDQVDGLKLWADDCVERERCLNCLNTFHNDEEFGSNQEIDFCCFLCKCPWDHPLKRTIRNCELGCKFHRPCCHGYQTEEDCESFVSSVGRVQKELLESMEKDGGELKGDGDAGATCNAEQDEDAGITSQDIDIVDGECEMYRQCLQNRFAMPRRKRDAVVVCINSGVGAAVKSLKRLGMNVSRIVHVEADRVAQHVLRSNHDFAYGELGSDDGIDHIVGLFDTLADLVEGAEGIVQKYGPIDVIIGAPPRAKTKDEGAQYANGCLDFAKDVARLNKQHHRFDDGPFFLLELSPDVKDHLALGGLSRCVLRSSLFVCNYPIFLERANLLSIRGSPGLPKNHVLDSVRDLFASLRKALCVGFSGDKWQTAIHPKMWNFLAMGPTDYDVQLNQAEFGPEAFSLHLRTPDNSELIDGEKYATHLIGQSSSVAILDSLLTPLQNLFNAKDYGPRYREQKKPAASPVKVEPKEEMTDDEADLFDKVERSLAPP